VKSGSDRVFGEDKLCVIARADLPPGPFAVQAIHAALQFSHEYPEEQREWFHSSNYLALLEAPDELSLEKLLYEAKRRGLKVSCFREPDLEYSLTAIALEPAGRYICKKLPKGLSSR
jgi:peptidyl-tRNA hydrolase